MTVERDPARQCAGKSTYDTKAEAKRHSSARKPSSVGTGSEPAPLTAYRCPHGDHFHFGHTSPWLRERILRGDEL